MDLDVYVVEQCIFSHHTERAKALIMNERTPSCTRGFIPKGALSAVGAPKWALWTFWIKALCFVMVIMVKYFENGMQYTMGAKQSVQFIKHFFCELSGHVVFKECSSCVFVNHVLPVAA